MKLYKIDGNILVNDKHNNHMHSDSKKRCSFLALLFVAGDVKHSQ
jgi:hypothetical protein